MVKQGRTQRRRAILALLPSGPARDAKSPGVARLQVVLNHPNVPRANEVWGISALRARGITPRIARKGTESSEKLGLYHWVAERSLAWLLGFRRLGVRYERRADILEGLLQLACALICVRSLPPLS
jgi:hypothetical protein